MHDLFCVWPLSSHIMRIKKQGHHFANKGPYSQVVMYRCESLDHKDGAQELMLLNYDVGEDS